ncbi:MAG: ABC transporter permease [Actinomycetota bacterium]|nr:ABC transporter permease [Actinomycetota bacterium]
MGQPVGRVDRVAAFGAVVALAGCFVLPFVEFRANRIVSGTPQTIAVAGTWGWALVAVCVTGLAAAIASPAARRGALVLAAGVATASLLPWALGSAAVSLQAGTDAVSRVSVGDGSWLVLVGAVIVLFQGSRSRPPAWLRWCALAAVAVAWALSATAGGLAELSLAKEFAAQSRRFWQLVGEHLVLSSAGLAFGVLFGVPLGVLASRNRIVRNATLSVVGTLQTVPSLALLGLLVFPLTAVGLHGIGSTPAIIALTLYALLPVVRNTYVGLAGVDPAALDAGRGMGMSRAQLLLRVEAPLALPLVLEGVRAAAVLVIGIAAVTAFVGAGGLGILVFQGWGQQADDLTLLGAIPMVVLAVVADAALRLLTALVVSPGIREEVA